MGGTYFRDGAYAGRRPRIAVSADGRAWSAPVPILSDGDWLWRVTRRESDGRAFGISYRLPRKTSGLSTLWRAATGEHYRELVRLPCSASRTRRRSDSERRIHDCPGQARSRTGESMDRDEPSAIHRLDLERCEALPGRAELSHRPGRGTLGAGRFIVRGKARTALARMTEEDIEPALFLPSGGDCSYPGMALEGGLLTLSYYSSHEGKASIYVAKVRVNTGK